MKQLLLAVLIVLCLTSFASAFNVCIWKECPKTPEPMLKVAPRADVSESPDMQVIPGINLNGDTYYIIGPRSKTGDHIGVGVGFTLIKFKNVVDVDAAWVKVIGADDVSNMGSLSIPVSLPELAKLFGANINVPNILTLKVGPALYLDMWHGFKPYGGFKATFVKATF